MNILALIAFLIALILLIVGVHVGWVIWLVVIGGILLAAFGGPIVVPWKR